MGNVDEEPHPWESSGGTHSTVARLIFGSPSNNGRRPSHHYSLLLSKLSIPKTSDD